MGKSSWRLVGVRDACLSPSLYVVARLSFDFLGGIKRNLTGHETNAFTPIQLT